MKVDLEKVDVQNLLAALNAVSVSGRENLIAVLRLIAKLEAALKEEPNVESGKPADGGHPVDKKA